MTLARALVLVLACSWSADAYFPCNMDEASGTWGILLALMMLLIATVSLGSKEQIVFPPGVARFRRDAPLDRLQRSPSPQALDLHCPAAHQVPGCVRCAALATPPFSAALWAV